MEQVNFCRGPFDVSVLWENMFSSQVPPFGSDEKDKSNFYLIPSVGPNLGLPGELSFNILPRSK